MSVGIDLVYIPAFASQLQMPGSRFEQVFSAGELRRAAAKPNPNRREAHLAGLWAAKEAFIKAWSAAHFGKPPAIVPEQVQWQEIEVTHDPFGRPKLRLLGDVAKHAGIDEAEVSISHDHEYATAVCVLAL